MSPQEWRIHTSSLVFLPGQRGLLVQLPFSSGGAQRGGEYCGGHM